MEKVKKILRGDEQVLLVLHKANNGLSRGEILDSADGMNKGSLGFFIQKSKKGGFIQRIGHGRWELTDNGKKEAEKLRGNLPKDSGISQVTAPSNADFDLEDIHFILKLKERYGKVKLLKIIDNIKKLIE